MLATCSSDLAQPVGVFRIAATDDVEEGALDFFGDRAARSAAQLDPVEFADGRDFSGRAGEEGLIGDVHTSSRVMRFCTISRPRSLAMWNTVLRVMPFRAPADRSGV